MALNPYQTHDNNLGKSTISKFIPVLIKCSMNKVLFD